MSQEYTPNASPTWRAMVLITSPISSVEAIVAPISAMIVWPSFMRLRLRALLPWRAACRDTSAGEPAFPSGYRWIDRDHLSE